MLGNVSDTTFLESCPHAKIYEDLVENDSDAVVCVNEKSKFLCADFGLRTYFRKLRICLFLCNVSTDLPNANLSKSMKWVPFFSSSLSASRSDVVWLAWFNLINWCWSNDRSLKPLFVDLLTCEWCWNWWVSVPSKKRRHFLGGVPRTICQHVIASGWLVDVR